MAAITTGKTIRVIMTSKKDAEINQNDENGERIIAEARWYLPGFKNHTRIKCPSLWASCSLPRWFVIMQSILCFLLLLPIMSIILFIFTIRWALMPINKPRFSERLYLTESSIVYTSVGDRHNSPYHRNFRINLANISHIKSVGQEVFTSANNRIEVRAHDVVLFQLKEDSTQEIHYDRNPGPCDCSFSKFKSVDSFAFKCHNGEEFVQAVKEQMAALNIK